MLKSGQNPLSTVFDRYESNVRTYCRDFPTVFASAHGSRMVDVHGRNYIDLLSGAGALNYGHNNPAIMERVIAYLTNFGVVHSLDMHTLAKAEFIEAFQNGILQPRGLNYKLQFPGPTGTNAVEAALKLVRKVTGRHQIISFTNGFHGMSLGALAATSNIKKRKGAGVPLQGVTFMPFDGYLPNNVNTMDYIEAILLGTGAGIDTPAAFLIETVQGEGGLNVASAAWMQQLERLARKLGALLIVDDIQAGIGRTGTFFSFETLGITPDIVVLSKSLSAFGTPMSLVLLNPEIDLWSPGEHNGTFRGNNLGFVGATAAIETYWRNSAFQDSIAEKSAFILLQLSKICSMLPSGTVSVKGRGLFLGLAFSDHAIPNKLSRKLFESGVIIETCGHNDEVLKLIPPLTISYEDLHEVMTLIEEAILAEQSTWVSEKVKVGVA